MAQLHATWTTEGHLFFWTPQPSLEAAVDVELPSLRAIPGRRCAIELVVPVGGAAERHRIPGLQVRAIDALPLLASLPASQPVSDSIRCWAWMTRLALELAAHHRVVPTVDGSAARWKAVLVRKEDKQRFTRISAALPPVARATPTAKQGSPRMTPSIEVSRAYLDTLVDGLYRQNAWPGFGRGWPLELAEALRGDQSEFRPRDARHRGIPDALHAWSQEPATSSRLVLELRLPGRRGRGFAVYPHLQVEDGRGREVRLDQAWPEPGTKTAANFTPYPALQALARAAGLFPPLLEMLQGSRPQPVTWSAGATWRFLSEGVDRLRNAGIEVRIPSEFAEAGRQRIRARLRIGAPPSSTPLLAGALPYRWEVMLGDQLMDGNVFARLLERREPIVRHEGRWVLLDPAALAKLPEGLPKEGSMPAAIALRAVLTGQHEGAEVVADDALDLRIQALRHPPEEPLPTGFKGELRSYQHRGYAWLSTMGRLGLGACLADDMGLGKTIQLIVHMLRRNQLNGRPSLVVCPTSVLGNWTRELQRFAPELRVLRYHGLQREAVQLRHADVVLTSYGLLARDQDALSQVPWDVLALDEAQAIKNPDSKRARAARAIQADHRVALSGTPVENRLQELWSLMEFLVPGMLGGRAEFRRQVAVPVERFGDEDIAHRLKLNVSPFLLRRLKTDPKVISDLPDKIEGRRYCPLTPEQATLYRQAVDDAMERISSSAEQERRGHVLAMLTALKQICNHPAHFLDQGGPLDGRSGKLDRFTDLITQIAEKGEHAIVFTQYRKMGLLLQGHLRDNLGLGASFLHGGTPAPARDQMVADFQSGQGDPVLVVSLRAGGTGLNLTRATHVVHFDRWWNPAVEDQATDRAYRIGQEQAVYVHKMVCQDTLEERIDTMLESKRALAEQVVGSGENLVTELDDSALRRLVGLGDDAVVEEA